MSLSLPLLFLLQWFLGCRLLLAYSILGTIGFVLWSSLSYWRPRRLFWFLFSWWPLSSSCIGYRQAKTQPESLLIWVLVFLPAFLVNEVPHALRFLPHPWYLTMCATWHQGGSIPWNSICQGCWAWSSSFLFLLCAIVVVCSYVSQSPPCCCVFPWCCHNYVRFLFNMLCGLGIFDLFTFLSSPQQPPWLLDDRHHYLRGSTALGRVA